MEVDLNEEFKKAFKNIAETDFNGDLPSGDEKTEESEVEEK